MTTDNHPWLLRLLAAAAMLVLVAGACSGDDDSGDDDSVGGDDVSQGDEAEEALDEDEYVDEYCRILGDFFEEASDIDLESSDLDEVAEGAELGRELIDGYVADLEDLGDPPGEFDEAIDLELDLLEDQRQDSEEIQAAAEEGDEDGAQEAIDELDQAGSEFPEEPRTRCEGDGDSSDSS